MIGAVAGGARDVLHFADVRFEGFAAVFGEAADGQGVLAFEGFGDDDVAGFFELGEVAGKIALGEAAFALEVEEVGFGDGVENGHDHEARGLVDDAIEGGECLQIGCHSSDILATGLRRRYSTKAIAPSMIFTVPKPDRNSPNRSAKVIFKRTANSVTPRMARSFIQFPGADR